MANIYDLPIQSISQMDDVEIKQFIRMRRSLRRTLPTIKERKKSTARRNKKPIKTVDDAINRINNMDEQTMAKMLETLKARVKK